MCIVSAVQNKVEFIKMLIDNDYHYRLSHCE
ncbi:hypothetical protein DFQ00_10494 [Paenibacillus barcinonensis]|uniref:Uncharacterized protein n=1 Tax=Paenibacillus barcinonensis TaxID=198119 RepID=A0A2V4VAJ9_PAEBA|nr:hypothetical protein DFQ00_10494 [Paenibacillus barcinonensis]